MKRFREGYKFPQDGNIHMTSRYENGELVIIPADENWQLMFRFIIEMEPVYKGECNETDYPR